MKRAALVLGLCILTSIQIHAQVRVDLSFDPEEYILFEAIEAKVRIINGTGEPLDLARMAKGQPWLDFFITQSDDFEVAHTRLKWEPPPMILLQGEIKKTTVNLLPYFQIRETGLYRAVAQVRVGNQVVSSKSVKFSVVSGTLLWDTRYTAQPRLDDKARAPRPRLYELIRHRHDDKQELFARISDPESEYVYCTTPLGPMVNDVEPSARVDREGNFYVFHQAGTRIFHYARLSVDGKRLGLRYFSNISSRPSLVTDEKDHSEVIGGEEVFVGKNQQPTMIPTAPTGRAPGE